ncbi:MAG: hypothetical protein LBR98_00740, partial [Syntrophomonadaceae bacterium]|nr:hypothetical protein [Syntrophomonadaceae bacterium]
PGRRNLFLPSPETPARALLHKLALLYHTGTRESKFPSKKHGGLTIAFRLRIQEALTWSAKVG